MGVKTVNILWTCGFDSSYRMVELSRMNVKIQPYYIYDHTRGSIKYEMRAMKRITDWINRNPNTKAEILPQIIIKDSEIQPDEEITRTWEYCRDKYRIGSQYDYLARFAKQWNLKLEMGLLCGEGSRIGNAIKGESVLKLDEEGEYAIWYIDNKVSSNRGVLLFEYMLLPVTMWEKTKVDELEGYKTLGAIEVAKMTHFCFTPVLGMPCGQCNPCLDALNEGMAFRVPLLGRLLGLSRSVCRRAFRLLKKCLGMGK